MIKSQQDWRAQLMERMAELKQQEEIVLEDLVDKIFQALLKPIPVPIKTLVGHKWPDDDVWLSFWLAKRFLPEAKDASILFVNAGEALPGSEGDPSVIHFDTGRGIYDQHGKPFKRTSSAEIFAKALGVREDPGLQALLEMVIKVDNVEPLDPTSIHFAIEGYPYLLKREGKPDWTTVQERVFELFEIRYKQETLNAKSRADLDKFAQWNILPNGLKVGILLWHPELREAAYEKGAAVVLWTQSLWMNKQTSQILTPGEFTQEKRQATKEGRFNNNDWGRVFYTGIQSNLQYPDLTLARVAYDLRFTEAWKRNILVGTQELSQVGQAPQVPQWFLHDSLRFVANGTRTHTPSMEALTKLSPTEIVGIVTKALSRIPRQLVSRWQTITL